MLAGALWHAATDQQVTDKLTVGGARRAMYTTLYKALAGGADGKSGLRELVQRARSDQSLFRLESSGGAQGVLDAIVASATHPVFKTALCAAFIDRFRAAASDIPACAGETSSNDECAGFQ